MGPSLFLPLARSEKSDAQPDPEPALGHCHRLLRDGLSINGLHSLLDRTTSLRNVVQFETGYARIKPRNLASSFPYTPQLQKRIEELGLDAAPRIRFPAELLFQAPSPGADGHTPNPWIAVQASVIGIDPERDPKVYLLLDSIPAEPADVFPDAGLPGVLLGEGLAGETQLEIGDQIKLRSVNRSGQEVLQSFTVSGLIRAPDPKISRPGIYIPIQTADAILQLGGGEISSLSLKPAAEPFRGYDIERQLSRFQNPFTQL